MGNHSPNKAKAAQKSSGDQKFHLFIISHFSKHKQSEDRSLRPFGDLDNSLIYN